MRHHGKASDCFCLGLKGHQVCVLLDVSELVHVNIDHVHNKIVLAFKIVVTIIVWIVIFIIYRLDVIIIYWVFMNELASYIFKGAISSI